MIEILLFLVPILYALMLGIEFFASFSRISGFALGRNALAYTFQNATFTLTRFFYILLMPAIGYLVDRGVSDGIYLKLVVESYVLTAVVAVLIYLMKNRVYSFYYSLIEMYIQGKGMLRSFLFSVRTLFLRPHVQNIPKFGISDINCSVFTTALFVYFIHATGVFLTFYFALSNFENRVMITQLSGIVNAVGTLLLTFKLDPALSYTIEHGVDVFEYHFSIYVARVLVFALMAPLLFTIIAIL